MQSFNRKDLSVIVVVLLLALAGGTYYWFKIRVPDVLSPEAVKNQCLEKMKNATNDELIQEIGNLEYTEEIDPVSGENRLTAAHKSIINYFICEAGYTKDENDYNKAKDLIESMSIQEENKQNSLSKLNDAFSGETGRGFLIELALGDIDDICPGKIKNLCLKTGIGIEEERFFDGCENICDKINQYMNDGDTLENEIIDNNDWFEDKLDREKQYKTRISIAFRLGGESLALRICNNLLDDEKKGCLSAIDYIKMEENENYCDEFRSQLEDFICLD